MASGMSPTKDQIDRVLKEAFGVIHLEIDDQSHLHTRHREAMVRGGGHYHLRIVSNRFQGLKLIERHRLIYEALKPYFAKEIHALAIEALTAEEWQRQRAHGR